MTELEEKFRVLCQRENPGFSREIAQDMVAFYGPSIIEPLIKLLEESDGDPVVPDLSIVTKWTKDGERVFLLKHGGQERPCSCGCGRSMEKLQSLIGSQLPYYETCSS